MTSTVAATFQRSPDVDLVPFGDGAWIYDAVTGVVHRVGQMAARLLAGDQPVALAEFSADLADLSVAAEIERGLEVLRQVGLIDRTERVPPPVPASGSNLDDPQSPIGAAHRFLDRSVAFRCPDLDLLTTVEHHLGVDPAGSGGHPADVVFDIRPKVDGRVVLRASETWDFPDRAGFLRQLPGVLNDFVARSHTAVVLHAGSVITPDGRVVAVTGHSGSGKSTLVAALVQRGCTYLSDEFTGVGLSSGLTLAHPKPLELNQLSCDLLEISPQSPPNVRPAELNPRAVVARQPSPPVSLVIAPTFEARAPLTATRMSAEEAARLLLDQTVNLSRTRRDGLAAVCEMARTVPAIAVVHGDAGQLADALLARELGTSTTG